MDHIEGKTGAVIETQANRQGELERQLGLRSIIAMLRMARARQCLSF